MANASRRHDKRAGQSPISHIYQYRGSDRSFCGSTISFMSFSDVLIKNLLFFSGELTIETMPKGDGPCMLGLTETIKNVYSFIIGGKTTKYCLFLSYQTSIYKFYLHWT